MCPTPDLRLESEVTRRRRAWVRDGEHAYLAGVCDDVSRDFGCVDNAVLSFEEDLNGVHKGTR